MHEPVIVCSHLPGEGHLHSKRFRVVPVLCADEFDYWRGLAEHWDTDATIVNAEHDIEWSDEHVAALLDCPEPLCTWAYRCNWISTGIASGVIAAGAGARDVATQPDAYYLQGGEEWAQWSAIGLVKIESKARRGPLEREPWNRLELAVEAAVRSPWHVHWTPELKHHHW